MTIYMINYDLKGPRRQEDINQLTKVLQSFSAWWHHFDNTWLIATPLSGDEVYDILRVHFREEDSFLISIFQPFEGNYWGWLPEEAWDWIEQVRYA